MTTGGGSNDLAFFIGIFLVIFAIWVGSGGPSRPLSFEGPFLQAPGTGSSTPRSTNSFTSFGNANLPGEPSTLRGTVSLSRDITGPMNDDPKREYVIVQLSGLSQSAVSLSGWKLVSVESDTTVTIPDGTEVAVSGRVNERQPITLKPGEEAILVTGRSPIGVSFKENICTGYLEQHQDFAPSLQMTCPTPTQEYTRFMDDGDDACLSFVRTIPYCTALTNTPNNVSGSCEEFLEEALTYNGCVAAHKSDPEFSGRSWRLFLNQSDDLWKRSHETILLVDSSGKTVDALSY
jgi:hypothetical protein